MNPQSQECDGRSRDAPDGTSWPLVRPGWRRGHSAQAMRLWLGSWSLCDFPQPWTQEPQPSSLSPLTSPSQGLFTRPLDHPPELPLLVCTGLGFCISLPLGHTCVSTTPAWVQSILAPGPSIQSNGVQSLGAQRIQVLPWVCLPTATWEVPDPPASPASPPCPQTWLVPRQPYFSTVMLVEKCNFIEHMLFIYSCA